MKLDGQSKVKNQGISQVEMLLAKRLNQSAIQKERGFKSNHLQEYEVSSMQKHMLDYEEMNSELGVYNLVSAVNISGKLDVEVLNQALDHLMRYNSALRTRFEKTAKSYRQVIEEASPTSLNYIDLSGKIDGEVEVNQLIQSESQQKMLLNCLPLLRVTVVKLASDKFVMILATHHTVMDGWSFGIVIRQLQNYYNLSKQNQPIHVIYEKNNNIDYLIWKKQQKTESSDYWVKELEGLKILRLESDFERSIQPSYQGKRLYFKLDQSLVNLIKQYEKTHHITASNIILSAYQLMLGKYTGQKDFVVGTAVADRENPAFRNLVGCLINTLGVRTVIDDSVSLGDYLKGTQKKFYEVMQHKDVDLYTCLNKIEYEQDNRFPTLFQAMYNYENTPKVKMDFMGMAIDFRDVETSQALFDLTLSVFDTNDILNGFIEYRSDLFTADRIEQLLQALLHIIETVVENPCLAVKDISLLSAEQEEELLSLNTQRPIVDSLVTEHFKKIVSAYGDNISVSFGDDTITYEQLDAASNKIADQLLSEVSPKSFIGVFMDKSIEAIVAVLAILKAGMVYVPIDTGYPSERVHYITNDAGIKTLLLNRRDRTKLDWASLGINHIKAIEDLLEKPNTVPVPKPVVDSEDAAYVIYTSGSTGNPKGVVVPHRGLCNVVEEQRRLFGLNEGSKILQFASFCFDASIFEMLMALGNGAELHVVDKDKVLGNHLTKFIKDKEITHICLTPSVLSLASPKVLDKLETIIVAGEACPSELVNMWGRDYHFFNAYGPTEATIWTTTAKCEPGKKMTIGKPLDNVDVFVLDEQLNLLPKGSVGELYIGGIGLCSGYLYREDLNKEKFISKTFRDGKERLLYATGDMVRWNQEGELDFLGRKDSQVKLRGFRIETDEIRASILDYLKAQDAVIGIINKGGLDVLYAVVKSGLGPHQTRTAQEIRAYLKTQLPHYMVPDIISFVSEIPLTWNGKADMRQIEKELLINIEVKRAVKEPETETQRALLVIWKNVLDTEDIGIDDNFFEIGGHSLTATKLINDINQQFHLDLTANTVFSKPTVLDMAAYFDKSDLTTAAKPIKKVERYDELELSPQQKQLWITEQVAPQNGGYNIVMPIHLKGYLDSVLLEKALNQLARNHEILRVNFFDREGIPYQIIRTETPLHLSHYYLADLGADQAAIAAKEVISSIEKRQFSLSSEPLIRVSVIHLGEHEYILVIAIHHIISDGWTMELLIGELSELYNSLLKGGEKTVQLARESDLQYLDYVYWLKQQKEMQEQQRNFWANTLDSDMPALSIPTDYRRPKLQSHNGNTVERSLTGSHASQLKNFCKENKITSFMFMMTVFSILLHKLSGERDLPIGVPVAGRSRKEMEAMLGFFVNTVVMRCNIEQEQTVSDYMETIRNRALSAFNNQDFPFDDVVKMISPDRDMSRSPLVQVMLNVQNPDGINFSMDGLEAVPYPLKQEISKFDLTLYVEEYSGEIKFRLVYNSDLYKEESMQEYLNQLCMIINSVLADKEVKIKDISIESQDFRRKLQAKQISAYRPQRVRRSMSCIDEIVSESARKYPDNVAMSDENGSITYSQLEEASEKLASVLASKGLGQGDIVIIYGERNMNLVISMLATLKIGGVFSIFDPEYPKARLEKQLASIKAKGVIVVNKKELTNASFLNKELKLYSSYDALMAAYDVQQVSKTTLLRGDGDLAYVLFTSGTTGTPNCVSTSHAPVIHFIEWFAQHYGLGQDSVFGLFAGLSHDPLIRDIFTPLFIGGRLAIQSQKSRYDIENIGQWINDQGINEINITPSLFMMLSEGEVRFPKVNHYFFGGEELTAVPIKRAQEVSPKASCTNFYGTTETPQVMGYYDIPQDFDIEKESIPIGSGIDGVELSIINESGLKAGLGELGEIYVETPYLSQGYVNNEKLNREKFLDSQEKKGWKIYKTGDVGRYRHDGSIIIEGRKDRQINVRGYRVETGDIELALSKHDNVRRSLVHTLSVKGREQLVAYLEVVDQGLFTNYDMRHFLLSQIPENIIPERFVLVSQIPLTPNGKVDYRRLPKAVDDLQEAGPEPKDEVEKLVKQIWIDVLNLKNLGIDDNFFDVGGHSLLLAQIKTRLEQAFTIKLKLIDLFTYPSIQLISHHIKQKLGSNIQAAASSTEPNHTRKRVKQRRPSFGNFKR